MTQNIEHFPQGDGAPLSSAQNLCVSALQTPEVGLQKATSSPLSRSTSVVVRLLLMGCVFALGWYTLTTFASLLSGPEPTRIPENLGIESFAPRPLPVSLQSLPATGPWTFGGQPWQVRVLPLADRERRERFRAPPASTVQGAKASDGERGLLSLMKLMGGVPHRQGPETAYVVTQPDFEAVLFTLQQGDQERVLLGRMVYPAEPGQWTLLEIAPTSSQVVAPVREEDRLLPLPADSQRLATRQDERGVVLCELASVARNLTEVRAYWQQQGWSVQQIPGRETRDTPLYCRKGSQTVEVWPRSTDPRTKRLVLFMIRLPTDPARRAPATAKE